MHIPTATKIVKRLTAMTAPVDKPMLCAVDEDEVKDGVDDGVLLTLAGLVAAAESILSTAVVELAVLDTVLVVV